MFLYTEGGELHLRCYILLSLEICFDSDESA